MVKPLNLNVSYQNQTCLISCQHQEIPEKIEECFNINFNDVSLYHKVGGGLKILSNLQDITDIMKIQIIDKNAGRRSLRSQNENDSSPNKLVASIIKKLEFNSPLNGPERKSLIEWLKGDSSSFSKRKELDKHNGIQRPEMLNKKLQVTPDNFPKKRKLDEDDSSCQRPETANKKIQAMLYRSNVKDDSTQTDNWNYALNETNTTDLIDEMKKLATSEMLDKDVAAHLMNVTFDDRRNFILIKAPPVTLIKDKYPLLFTAANEVKNELDRIFYVGKCEEFLKNMKEYSKFILKHCKESDRIRILTEKIMSKARTPIQKAYAEVVGSVFALSQMLDEEFRFIHLIDYPHGSDDVYPHIDASIHSFKDIFFDNIIFSVVVEGHQLCKANNFLEAILCLISSFFIFNINYPESCKGTLTCFEKLYLCANDTLDVDEKTLQIIKLFSLQVKESRKHDI